MDEEVSDIFLNSSEKLGECVKMEIVRIYKARLDYSISGNMVSFPFYKRSLFCFDHFNKNRLYSVEIIPTTEEKVVNLESIEILDGSELYKSERNFSYPHFPESEFRVYRNEPTISSLNGCMYYITVLYYIDEGGNNLVRFNFLENKLEIVLSCLSSEHTKGCDYSNTMYRLRDKEFVAIAGFRGIIKDKSVWDMTVADNQYLLSGNHNGTVSLLKIDMGNGKLIYVKEIQTTKPENRMGVNRHWIMGIDKRMLTVGIKGSKFEGFLKILKISNLPFSGEDETESERDEKERIGYLFDHLSDVFGEEIIFKRSVISAKMYMFTCDIPKIFL